ncbi:MAG TPA: hypothetical protein VGF69_01970 [Thermoanaerobaculia bacterium]|jgi:hypothetical protein
MTMRAFAAVLLALLLASCATSRSGAPPAPSRTAPEDILGVRLNMPRAEVRTALAERGKFEREERKQQEIWTVDDPRFASLIVGYDPDWTVRYVTAVAKPEGAPVRYADVLDVAGAEHKNAGATHTYTWPAGKYYVIAIGGPEKLEYLSLKKDPSR